MDPERAERARRRAAWPSALSTLEDQADAAIVRHGTAEERIAMVWRVTLDAWAISGRPLPRYTRAQMPVRIVRSGDGR